MCDVCMCVWRSEMEIGRGGRWERYGAIVGNGWMVLCCDYWWDECQFGGVDVDGSYGTVGWS